MKISENQLSKYKDIDINFPYCSNENDNITTMEYNLLCDNIPMNLYNQRRYYFIMEFIKSLNYYESKAGDGIMRVMMQGYDYTPKQMVTMYLCIIKAEKVKDSLK